MKTHQSIDPAVEEVLASIRQIMAIDAEQTEENTSSELISFPGLQTHTSQKPGSENSDILTLTEVVGTDGSVTSLSEREAEMASKKDTEKNTGADTQSDDSTLEGAEATTLDLKDEVDSGDTTLRAENAESTVLSVEEKDIKMVSSEDIESLMSPEAVLQSTEAFAGLSQLTIDMQQKIKSGSFGNQTIDELMREMLRPLLKEWLDSHLPSLVKWLVAEKIEQMIREKQAGAKKAG